MRRLSPWSMAVAAALGAAACGDRARPEPPEAALSVTDDAGAQVRLPRSPRRIVSLVPYVTDFVVALGEADRLVGRTDYDTDPRLRGVASVGGGLTPSIERILQLRPDLVVTFPDAHSRTVEAQLEALGLPVYGATHGRLADMDGKVARLGRLLGREAGADSLTGMIRRELAAVRGAVAGREAPGVLYLIARDPLIVAGGGSFIDELITAAGGRNAFGDLPARAPQVSMEAVLQRAPGRIVVPRMGPGSPPALDWLRAAPGWSELEAVRAGRVLDVDEGLFARPGPQVPGAVRRLAGWLHADAFPPGDGARD